MATKRTSSTSKTSSTSSRKTQKTPEKEPEVLESEATEEATTEEKDEDFFEAAKRIHTEQLEENPYDFGANVTEGRVKGPSIIQCPECGWSASDWELLTRDGALAQIPSAHSKNHFKMSTHPGDLFCKACLHMLVAHDNEHFDFAGREERLAQRLKEVRKLVSEKGITTGTSRRIDPLPEGWRYGR